jgi:hypothetical protein
MGLNNVMPCSKGRHTVYGEATCDNFQLQAFNLLPPLGNHVIESTKCQGSEQGEPTASVQRTRLSFRKKRFKVQDFRDISDQFGQFAEYFSFLMKGNRKMLTCNQFILDKL